MSYAISRESWLKERCKGIGGSDAAAVLGLSRYKSPLEVYLNKIGEGIEVESTERMQWGLKLERLILDEYGARTGYDTQHNANQEISIHEKYDWFICTCDGWAYKPFEEKGVIECKNIDKWSASEWQDGHVPDEYLIQLQHNVGVTGCTWGVLCVLIGGNEWRYYEFDRDDELIALIIEKERAFWFDNVLARVPPDATGASLEVLGKLYKHSNETSITLRDNAVGEAILSYLDAKAHVDDYTKRKEDAESVIKAAMQDAGQGIYYDGEKAYSVSWSDVKGRLSFDTKRLEAEKPEIFKQYSYIGQGYRRFQVKEKVAKIGKIKKEEITNGN